MRAKSRTSDAILLFSLAVLWLRPVAVEATHYIPTGRLIIGTWDSVTRTYTLTRDVTDTIQITHDNITFDGAGHAATGPGSGYGIYLAQRTGVTVRNTTVQGFTSGVFLENTQNSRVENVSVSGNQFGVHLSSASNNVVTGNTANANESDGVFLQNSTGNALTANTVSDNDIGIEVRDSVENALANNYVSSSQRYGIILASSGQSTLRGNTMVANWHNIAVDGPAGSHFDNDIDQSNTVDGKPVYYVKNVANVTFDSATNAGVFYAVDCNNITIKDLTMTNNQVGVRLWNTHNSRIDNVTVLLTKWGIYLSSSTGNTLSGNAASSNRGLGIVLEDSSGNLLTGNHAHDNGGDGIHLVDSNDNTLTANEANSNGSGAEGSGGIYLDRSHNNVLSANTASSNASYGVSLLSASGNTLQGNRLLGNGDGLDLRGANDNRIYNNEFLDNENQVLVEACTANTFCLAKPIGGNYWSDWTGPDADGDGFVDGPYVFAGGQDDLPLAAHPVHLDDPDREAAVRQALGVPTDLIMPADMLHLTSFPPITDVDLLSRLDEPISP